MNQLASLNSKLLSTGKKYTSAKSKTAITNETIDLTMILFIYGCFFILMFVILILNSDYKNLDKYKHFSHDTEPLEPGFINRLKSWFMCGQECKVKSSTYNHNRNRNSNHNTNSNSTPLDTGTNTTLSINKKAPSCF